MPTPWCIALLLACPLVFVQGLSRQLLIVGLGRVGTHVAKQCRFERIVGTIRGPMETTTKLEKEEQNEAPLAAKTEAKFQYVHECVLFTDLDRLKTVAESSSHVLVTIPAPARTDITTWASIEALAASLSSSCWVGIVSSTGVYGDHQGRLVTEESECRCSRDSPPGRLLDFEEYWENARVGCLRIFRCAGIYGGGRSALHTVYKQGFRGAPREDYKTSRIHVDDLASAIVASMLQDRSSQSTQSRVYNLADNLPESRQVVLEYAKMLLERHGIQVEKTIGEELSERSSRRRSDRKIVDNGRMRRELCEPRYPTYKEGLAAVLHESDSPWSSSSPL